MSALPEPEPPKTAWVWTTETMKNCMLGKHEADTATNRVYWMDMVVTVCKHCRCLFVESSMNKDAR